MKVRNAIFFVCLVLAILVEIPAYIWGDTFNPILGGSIAAVLCWAMIGLMDLVSGETTRL